MDSFIQRTLTDRLYKICEALSWAPKIQEYTRLVLCSTSESLDGAVMEVKQPDVAVWCIKCWDEVAREPRGETFNSGRWAPGSQGASSS